MLEPIAPEQNPNHELCAHCGFEALGYATVTNPPGQTVRVCHHEKRDCYADITVWGATLGKRCSGSRHGCGA